MLFLLLLFHDPMNIHGIVTLNSLQTPRAQFLKCCDLEVIAVSAISMNKGPIVSTEVFPYKGESTL